MTYRLRINIEIAVIFGAVVFTAMAGRAFHSPDAKGSFHVLGAGGSNCAEMTSNLQTEPQAWSAVYGNYVTGFVTGANFVSHLADHQDANVGSDIAPEALFASIEQFCRQNPSRGVHAALEGVYSQLAARR